MKHTPGPWEVGEEEDDSQWVHIWAESELKLVCSVSNEDVSREERLANANLIAAAPILNDENERLLHLLNECFGVFDNLGIESKLRDAIVKALNDADDRVSDADQLKAPTPTGGE